MQGIRHEGASGYGARALLRKKLADWLLDHKDDAEWQLAAVRTGEAGLALDIAAREAERARAKPPASIPVVAGDNAIDPEAENDLVAASATVDDLTDLIEDEPPPDLDPFVLHTLIAYIGADSEFDAFRLAQHLSPDELASLVDTCAQNPDGMCARRESQAAEPD